MAHSPWLRYALFTTVTWGIWGAFTGLPSEHGFPDTLTYVVWAFVMLLPAVVVLKKNTGGLARDGRSIRLGLAIGLLGAGGQLLLFHAVTLGPTYLIFPIVSLSPIVTIALSVGMLGERTGKLGIAGIVLAVLSLPMFDYSPEPGSHSYGLWFYLSIGVMVAWGLQAYFMKLANASMSAENIFAYMTISGIALVPFAFFLTDFSHPVNLGISGPPLAAVIQLLNAVGALLLVYAFRYGKAIVVSPLVNAGAPLLTAVISLALVGVLPGPYKVAGIVLALAGALCLSMQPDEDPLRSS
jgi:drug/metabolite transporter (DMT)-like permease